jgi:hypothetical protein
MVCTLARRCAANSAFQLQETENARNNFAGSDISRRIGTDTQWSRSTVAYSASLPCCGTWSSETSCRIEICWAPQSNHPTSHNSCALNHKKIVMGFQIPEILNTRTDSSRFWWRRDISRLLPPNPHGARTDGEKAKPSFWLSAPANAANKHMKTWRSSTACDARKCSWDVAVVLPTATRPVGRRNLNNYSILHQTENVYHGPAEVSAPARFKGALQRTTTYSWHYFGLPLTGG